MFIFLTLNLFWTTSTKRTLTLITSVIYSMVSISTARYWKETRSKWIQFTGISTINLNIIQEYLFYFHLLFKIFALLISAGHKISTPCKQPNWFSADKQSEQWKKIGLQILPLKNNFATSIYVLMCKNNGTKANYFRYKFELENGWTQEFRNSGRRKNIKFIDRLIKLNQSNDR